MITLTYWLQQDILQVKNFQYRFVHNITLNNDTIPRVKVFTHFLLIVFKFNYQLLWEQQDQQAYVNFPQKITETELLPFIIKYEYRHLQYRDLTSVPVRIPNILKHQITDLTLQLTFLLKQPQKTQLLMT